MNKPVIAVADGAFADRAGIERDFGDRAELRWADLSGPDAVRESTSGADALVVTLQRLPADVIMAFAPSVRAIGRAGVGLDTIDLRAAAGRGIAVFNQPAYGAAEVASHALALLLAVQRRLLTADAHVRAGWHGGADLGRIGALDDSTVGVLGAGRIGRAFIDRVARSSATWPSTIRSPLTCRRSRSALRASTTCSGAVSRSACTCRSPRRPGA